MSRKIVIVGGGASGAELACALGRRAQALDLEVALVDLASSHCWKPRLHEVAAGLQSSSSDALPYLSLARNNNFRFHLGPLTGLTPQSQTIKIGPVKSLTGAPLLDQRILKYDTLVLAFGSTVNDFGIPGVHEHCFMLDSLEQAICFQRRLLETAVAVSAGRLNRLKVGIVGAGATGIELAAELCHAVKAMDRLGGLLAADLLDITVIDMATRPLANCTTEVSDFVSQTLQRLGVNLRLDSGVINATSQGFTLNNNDFIECDLKVWASGVIGRPLAAELNLSLDRSRRILCDPYLRCNGIANVFAMGDCAAVVSQESGRALPTTAQVAHQQASYLYDCFTHPAALHQPFRYQDKGTLVSLGAEPATGEFPVSKQTTWSFNGALPKLAYKSLQSMHRAKLFGWRKTVWLLLSEAMRRSALPPVKLH